MEESRNHYQLERFESHLARISEQLDLCLKGIAENEHSLKALRQRPSIVRDGVPLSNSAPLPQLPGPHEIPGSYASRPTRLSAMSNTDDAPKRLSLTSTGSNDDQVARRASRTSEASNLLDPTLSAADKTAMRELMKVRRAKSGHSSKSNLLLWSKSFDTLSVNIVSPAHRQPRTRTRFEVELWKVLDEPGSSREATWAGKASSFLICVSVLLTLLGSGTDLRLGFESVVIQLFCDSIFSLELLARFYCCPSRSVFLREIYTYFELVASLPILAIRVKYSLDEPLEANTWPYMVLVALAPVFRLLMLLRRLEQIQLQLSAFRSAAEALPVMLCTLSILITGFAAMVFVVEPRDNIDTFGEAIWMTVVTCFTVGYGDTLPVSQAGRGVLCCLMAFSALYMAIPIGIVGDAFSRAWAERESLLLVSRMSRRLKMAHISAADVAALFYRFDKDQKGLINRTEFLEIVQAMSANLVDVQALQLFNIIDADGSGGITDEEFVRVLFPSDFHKIYSALDSLVDITKHVAFGAANAVERASDRLRSKNSAHSDEPLVPDTVGASAEASGNGDV